MSMIKNYNLKAIPECPSDDGAISYFNKHKKEFHVDGSGKTWAPCVNLLYSISEHGSLTEYSHIFEQKDIKVWIFSGDWDDQVPFPDTVQNLEKLGKFIHKNWHPWFVEDHHAGHVFEE